MNRRTALGAIAASPVLVASAGASPDKVTVDVPQINLLDFQISIVRVAREVLPAVAMCPDAVSRAFAVAEGFVAEALRRTDGFTAC